MKQTVNRQTLLSILFTIFCSPAPAAETQAIEDGEARPIAATVTWCNDGDTCRVVTSPGKLWLNVRLAGIDAPETAKKRRSNAGATGQPGGEAAKEFLNKSLVGKEVSLIQTDLDPYNRPVVEVMIGSMNFNLEMVRQGYAEAYKGKTKRLNNKAYLDAESSAKSAKQGIWALERYESPADYRKRVKN